MTPEPLYLEHEKRIQKAWDAVSRRQARGESEARMRQRYDNWCRAYRWMVQQGVALPLEEAVKVMEQQPETFKEGDFVRTGADVKIWIVDEVEGDCAWISDKHGNEEWVPLSQLEKVGRK